MKLSSIRLAFVLLAQLLAPVWSQNSTFHNPVLSGWHSDPSCIQHEGTFYCVISTFITFPGLPIYASKDLLQWKLIGHVWTRESQLPGYSWNTNGQQEGMFAATIRENKGIFYVICEYLGVSGKKPGVLFRTTNPYDETTWSNAVFFDAPKIDPDLFWDDDGKVYVATHSVVIQEFDLATGRTGPAINIWNGTGGVWPEGPHIYKKDGWYYLMIAEGGTATDHAVTIARAKKVTGPYTGYERNPILTNRKTQEFFQTVGHADLFQDTNGKWWGMCLATRSGPQYQSYPMGRETVLFPVTWNKDEWPILAPVRGVMSGWALPAPSREVPGTGPWNVDPDVYDFKSGQPIPRNLIYWRIPRDGAVTATDSGLQLVLARNNLQGAPNGNQNGATRAISFIARRQTHSLFTYSVDLTFAPTANNQEAGVTAFLTQQATIQLGVVQLNNQLTFRFATNGTNSSPTSKTQAVPTAWVGKPIRLQIQMSSINTYTLSAMLASDTKTKIAIGTGRGELLSGGSGSFVGTLVGVYATCNGNGSGLDCPSGTPNAHFQRWRYTGAGQFVSATATVPTVVDMAKSEV
ncbi:glycoside hydrolase family 43 protein [Immersiella caudata]|uniref:Glycoside hydrolase family 43 protein n=1 Tax=Immersiella caudata TaxID=314043 RepID=A0AA39WYD0_9PEZI|nr:glycoside hydrolase family 43 protein [Immersiella caudata]